MPDRLPFVAIGESLAAGAGDFGLHADGQRHSFVARFAARIGAPFPLPLLEPPGLEVVPPGYAQPPLRVPAPLQWGVLEDLPPRVVANVSIPGLTISDALHLRPEPPLIRPDDPKGTAVNLLLGLAAFALDAEPLTPVEYAVGLRPEMALVCLGYTEALQAAAGGAFPDHAFTETCIGEILGVLGDHGVRGIVATVPDPFETAGYSTIVQASECLRIEPDVLLGTYGLAADDRLTPAGLMTIGSQFFGRAVEALPKGCVRHADEVERVRARIARLNRAIERLAARRDVRLFDLAAAFSRVAVEGVPVSGRRIAAGYLGGFYSLTGVYPGAAGHAWLAHVLVGWANESMGARIPEIVLGTAATSDPVLQYRAAAGPKWSASNLPRPLPRRAPRAAAPGVPPAWPSAAPAAITLPPSRECVLTLNPAGSYFGDAIAPLNGTDPARIRWGSSAHWLFGGFAMVDSPLHGRIRIRFGEPADGRAAFELSFLDGLRGEDATLAAPLLFEMPFQRNRVDDVAGQVSRGVVDLATGDVTGLTVFARYASNALMTLVAVNPTFPRQPLSFPGPYGTSWARFEQRGDGSLDFTFAGTTFVPLGAGIRWPLPFGGPTAEFATVPASGTVMHPHLYLTTKPSAAAADRPAALELPANTLREYVLHAHNSAFGDAFELTCPDLGGKAKGRSHIMGRLQIQFGPESNGWVPVACSMLGPAGVFARQDQSPITEAFPGRLSTGALGFYELLRFPLRTYALDDLAVISDPFDVSVGLVHAASGRFLHPLLHRGFIHQDLIFALLRVEPRTPRSSFDFRGPARFEAGADGQPVFRFEGEVVVPYPQGFRFPRPDLSLSYTIGPDSVLEPFLWLQARERVAGEEHEFDDGAENVVSSTGDIFSYRVRVASDGHPPKLVYQNHSQEGCFSLRALTWAALTNSRFGASGGAPDTLTLSGLGVWRKDGTQTIQPVAAQFCRSSVVPYIGIQIGSGMVSNVNTRPPEEAARP